MTAIREPWATRMPVRIAANAPKFRECSTTRTRSLVSLRASTILSRESSGLPSTTKMASNSPGTCELMCSIASMSCGTELAFR